MKKVILVKKRVVKKTNSKITKTCIKKKVRKIYIRSNKNRNLILVTKINKSINKDSTLSSWKIYVCITNKKILKLLIFSFHKHSKVMILIL